MRYLLQKRSIKVSIWQKQSVFLCHPERSEGSDC